MSISKYFQHVLTFTVCCTAAVIISVAANMLLSIRTAEADNEVDCYKKENGITFKCDARSDDICAWTVVKKESDNLVSNPGATNHHVYLYRGIQTMACFRRTSIPLELTH
mgnify:CR=1 FL=1